MGGGRGRDGVRREGEDPLGNLDSVERRKVTRGCWGGEGRREGREKSGGGTRIIPKKTGCQFGWELGQKKDRGNDGGTNVHAL